MMVSLICCIVRHLHSLFNDELIVVVVLLLLVCSMEVTRALLDERHALVCQRASSTAAYLCTNL